MRLDVSLIAMNEYRPEEIVRENIPEKYVLDEEGNIIVGFTVFDAQETVSQLIEFLFQGLRGTSVPEVHRDSYGYVLDLTLHKELLIDFDYLEKFYPKWIEVTGRLNTMSEYGTLIDFVGFGRSGLKKKYLFIAVSNERYSREQETGDGVKGIL